MSAPSTGSVKIFYSPAKNIAVDVKCVSRRSFLAGGSALLIAGCGGGESGSSISPSANAAAAAPAPALQPAPIVYGPDIVTVQQFYRPEDGSNLQPAFQKAILEAEGTGRKLVNDYGAKTMQLWAPTRQTGFWEKTPDGVPLVITKPIHIDFKGATFMMRGPRGGGREQILAGSDQPWLGGWIYAFGDANFDRLTIENVVADGGFEGEWRTNANANLSDKGFRLQDTDIKEIYMRNVEMRNFAAEIYYIGGLGPKYQELENCHFHGSPQCAFNPGGVYKLKATNLQAGRSYQTVEAVCGAGHTYTDSRFYQAGHGGAFFMPGPVPTFKQGYPYWYTIWDGQGDPPYNQFNNVTFEDHNIHTGSFARGNLKLIDSMIFLTHKNGRLDYIDLTIDSLVENRTSLDAVWLTAPRTATERVPDTPPGTFYGVPNRINLDIRLLRSAAAMASGLRHQSAVTFEGGRVDTASISIKTSGEAATMQRTHSITADFVMPPSQIG